MRQNREYVGDYWQHGVLVTSILGFPCWLLGVHIASELASQKTDKRLTTQKIVLLRLVVWCAASLCSIARFHLSLSYTLSLNLFAILAAFWIWSEIKYWRCRALIPFIEKGGKWSYSLYICHPIPLILFREVGYLPNYCVLGLQILLSCIFSYCFYLLIEKPSHRLVSKVKVDSDFSFLR